MLETVLLALTAFALTNIDDAFVLLAFFADPTLGARNVVIGQYVGMVFLSAAAAAFAMFASAIPDRYIGLMGFLPILIGLRRLRKLWRSYDEEMDVAVKSHSRAGALGAILSVASVTIANGGDNIAVYVPLFVRSSATKTLLICCVFAAMVALWCVVARWLIRYRQFGAVARKWGRRVMPFALIALGGYILLRTGALQALPL
jgi:cadmium resistance protein CadD (predicted permease)